MLENKEPDGICATRNKKFISWSTRSRQNHMAPRSRKATRKKRVLHNEEAIKRTLFKLTRTISARSWKKLKSTYNENLQPGSQNTTAIDAFEELYMQSSMKGTSNVKPLLGELRSTKAFNGLHATKIQKYP